MVEGAEREAWLRYAIVFDVSASINHNSAMPKCVDLGVGPLVLSIGCPSLLQALI